MTLNDRVVNLVHRAIPERLLEPGVCDFGLGERHQTACANIEALHDALAFLRSRGREMDTVRQQRAADGRAIPTNRGMRCHTRRLIDHNDVGVLIDDLEARHLDRHQFELVLRLGHANLEQPSRNQSIRLA